MFREIMSGARVMMVLLAINGCSLIVSSMKRRPRRTKAESSDIEARVLRPDPIDSTEDLSYARIPPGPNHHMKWVKHHEERRELLGGDC